MKMKAINRGLFFWGTGTGIFTVLNKKGNFGLHLFYHKLKCKMDRAAFE